MSALNPLRLKGEPFGANLAAGDYSSNSPRVMQNNTPSITPPPQYRFPDVPPPSLPSPQSSSPSDSPSDSPASASSSAHSLSLRPLVIFAPQPQRPASPLLSLADFYIPALTPDEILDTLDHLASVAPKKKSHARKQPAGHIPRPRNAFILFRCLFVSQQAVPASVEKDHRNISRIAGKVWKSMSNEQRDPWVKASELEKTRHEARFPNYRYNPVQPQVGLPRRFAQAIFKHPTSVRPKREDDDRDRDRDRDRKMAHVAGADLEAAVHGGYSPVNFYDLCPPQFTLPFAATPPGAYSSEMSLPPDSPPPTPTHFRLAARRSSSCPPLPPLAAAFPFNNPNPWLAAAPSSYTSQASSPSPSPFAYSFPPPPPPPQPAFPPDHRPLTAPEHDFFPLAPPRFLADSRLAHRRGSSLDRAIASSSIAGAFGGGGLPRHWTPDPAFSRRPSQAQVSLSAPSSSSDAGTPALSPQSSFERGRSAMPRALEDSEDVMIHDDSSRASSPRARHSPPFPRRRSPAPPPTKVPARLFGSQGARLGLDLDLDDVPLALDVSFPPSYSPASAFPPSSSSSSSLSEQEPFSYTRALLMDTDC